jgi:hypothetical protein
MSPSRRASLLLLALVACGGGDDDTPGTPDAPASIADARPDAGPPPAATGTIVLAACSGLAESDEPCELVTNASACSTTRCAKLAVLFSGGDMSCESSVFAGILGGFAAQGWAAVCINVFDTNVASGAVPYLDEQARYDLAVRTATTGAWGTAYWTGAELLFAGISHGATAPVIVMARSTLDDAPAWRGTARTAGCFFDGSYDQAASADLLSTGAAGGNPCTFPVPYQRWLERYCGDGASPDTCDLATEPAAVADTITAVDPSAFAITDLRLVECGSATPTCTGDILPAAPIEALCTHLDDGPAHTCTFAALPDLTHLNCFPMRYADCITWFDAL